MLWDQIIENVNSGNMEKTLPETLPALCNVTQLPLGSSLDRFNLKQHQASITAASIISTARSRNGYSNLSRNAMPAT